MCGITGFINFSGHDKIEARARITRMANTLIHRGPDEEGFFVDEFAALGHRRLSIIDLSSGQQPMSALDGQIQIVFNGEIYNFQELRNELERKGHRFRTHSDTEVILKAYVEWAEHCVDKLNGMFAFAIWDSRCRQLFLARDKVGKKPLYFYRNGDVFAFASELKALRGGNFCPDTIDPEALDCYFSFGYIPSPRTIYRAVKKMPGAHWMIVTQDTLRQQRYWRLSFAEKRSGTLEDAVDEFESLLDDAVKCRLISEVPLGVFLSGGLDSTLVVSSMARLQNEPVITNSIGFDDENFNELPLAKLVAEDLKTDHHEFVVKPDILDVLQKIAWHFDEPFADSSAVPTWYVCQMARKNVTVALSGDGGDESFGGYTFRYIPHFLESSIRAALPALLRRPLFGLLGAVWSGSARLPKPLRLKTILENLAVSDAEAFYRDLIWLRGDTRASLYSRDFMQALQGFTPMETVYPFYAGSDAPDALGRSQDADIHFYMTDDVLVKVDRMSMAHSLEVRSPLLDYRILEFAARLPGNLKIDAGKGKLLLRKLASRRLPAELENRPKLGFSIPAAAWLRNELKPVMEQELFDRSSPIAGILEENRVRSLWKEHLDGSRDHSVFLWAVMTLGLWQRGVGKGPA
ncbi:MAG: asparagine synthase (glutamine-hydrolyzing) [Gammaproteobacteria bacterium]